MYLYIEYKNVVYAVDMYIMMLVEYNRVEYYVHVHVCSSCLHDTSTVAM